MPTDEHRSLLRMPALIMFVTAVRRRWCSRRSGTPARSRALFHDHGQLKFGCGQLECPLASKAKAIQVGGDLYDERSVGKTTVAARWTAVDAGHCVGEGGHGPEHSWKVPAGSAPAKRDATKA